MRNAIALVVLISLLPTVARAEGTTEPDAVRDALHLWHRRERLSGLIPFVGSGVATGTAGAFLLASTQQRDQVAGGIILGFGILELAAGLVFGLASLGSEARRDEELTADRAAFLLKERARLDRINTVFQPVLLGFEAALVLGGGITAGVGALKHDDLALGIGLGLAVQALVFFLLDWAVADRAAAYGLALGQAH